MILPITAKHEYARIRDDALALLHFDGLPCLPIVYCKDGEEMHPTLNGEWCSVFQLGPATYVFRDSVWRVFPALQLPHNTAWGGEIVNKQVYISEFLGDSGLTKDSYLKRRERVASLQVPTTLHASTTKPWPRYL